MVTKFTHGAYLVVIAIPLLCVMMQGNQPTLHAARPDRTSPDLRRADTAQQGARHRAGVQVAQADAAGPRVREGDQAGHLTALTVNVDDEDTWALLGVGTHDIPVPLTVIESPYREITRPVVDYIKKLRKNAPHDVVNVYIPEYVVGRWWRHVYTDHTRPRTRG